MLGGARRKPAARYLRKGGERMRLGFYILTGLCAVLLLWVGTWPGLLSSFCLTPFVFFVLCWAFHTWCGLASQVFEPHVVLYRPKPPVLLCGALLCACVVLGLCGVPRMAVVWFNRDRLEALAATAPVTERGVPLHRCIGPVYVSVYGADHRGGVYFVTEKCQTSPDLDANPVYYGFAFRPTSGGPFGVTQSISHLFGDWYSFSSLDYGD